jgi:hypothetical protein
LCRPPSAEVAASPARLDWSETEFAIKKLELEISKYGYGLLALLRCGVGYSVFGVQPAMHKISDGCTSTFEGRDKVIGKGRHSMLWEYLITAAVVFIVFAQ